MSGSTVKLQMDGVEVELPRGTRLLEGCRRQGQKVPALCHEDRLEPFGGCRMCLVEVEGSPRPLPACRTEAEDGMVVTSHSPRLEQLRGTMAEMLLSAHAPSRGGRPDAMRKLAKRFGIADTPIQLEPDHVHHDRNRFLGLDSSACILCDRCVRYCDEIMQVDALEHVGIGPSGGIQPTSGRSFLDTDCELCGGCISSCPTGALYERQAEGVVEGDCDSTRTVCTFCGVGCVLDLKTMDGRVVKVTAEDGVGPNEGHLCNKGRFAWEFIHHPDRLTTPLLRSDEGELVPATWEQAFTRVAEGLEQVKREHGADSIGFLASSRCTNEDVYLLQKLARGVVGTNNIHSCAAT